MRRSRALALAGGAAGLVGGAVAERMLLNRKRARDPEAGESFGSRRGDRSRMLDLPDGARLFVEETGPVSPVGLVFVHGSALRTDLWHYQIGAFGDRRSVFYDLRGHGLSRPSGDAEMSIATLADDLLAVIEDCGLEETVLVGHSVGGMIALELGRRRPDLLGSRIAGFVLSNTTHRPAVETIFGGAAVVRLERVLRRPLDSLGKRSVQIDYLRRIVKPSDAVFWGVAVAAFGPGASARQIDFVYDMLAETPSEVIFDLIRSYRDFEMTDALGEVTAPALVIAGSHDRLTVPQASAYLAEHLPKARLELFEGCGHMAMLERHERFNEVLEDFLTDVLGPADRRESG